MVYTKCIDRPDQIAKQRIKDALRDPAGLTVAGTQVAAQASAWATKACVDAWRTDFRDDVARVDESGIPVLLHGTADVNLSIGITGSRR